ncbi:MAG: aldehyde dehydrogenase family protein [Balneolales bacterium]|nr:aldehyde dehydrogenase family protein [Balneolales bacterium]
MTSQLISYLSSVGINNDDFFSKLKFVPYRLNLLKKLHDSIIKNRLLIIDALNTDLGKPAEEAELTEIIPALSEIRLLLKNLPKWSKPAKVKRSLLHYTSKAYIDYQPKGVVLVLSPWNYPFVLNISPLACSIASGNRTVVKPSEFTPAINSAMRTIFDDCFENDEVLLVEGEAETAEYLVNQPFNHIFFTGSPAIGKKVMMAAAENLCPVTLELGGKSPCIVDKTANIKKAARRIAWGKMINCGQTCIAPDYLCVHNEIAEEFEAALFSAIKDLEIEDSETTKKKTNYGKIIHKKHFDYLKALLEDALARGARLISGGHFSEDTKFFSPTVLYLRDDPYEYKVMQNEIFGPILPFITWDKPELLIKQINKLERPLATYLFANNKKLVDTIKNGISTGGLVINDTLSHFVHPHLPFGGINNSGIGRTRGFYGFEELSNRVSVLESGPGPAGAELFSPPYTNIQQKLIEKGLKFL